MSEEIKDTNRRFMVELLAPSTLRRAIALQNLSQFAHDYFKRRGRLPPPANPWISPLIELINGRPCRILPDRIVAASPEDPVCLVFGVSVLLEDLLSDSVDCRELVCSRIT